MNIPPFSATGIGSLPHIEPRAALELVFSAFGAVPHWPQLPNRGRREGMVYQSFTPLVETGLLAEQGDRVRFATAHADWPARLTEFYSLALAAEAGDPEALGRFAPPRGNAAGFYAFIEELERKGTEQVTCLKGQIVGPLTAGFFLKDEQGKAAYYDAQLRDLVVRTLTYAARWQALELLRFGRPVLVFIDDLGLNVYGQSSYITVTREMIKEDLGKIAGAVKSAGALAGLHSCTAVDWSIPFELDFSVVSLDAFNYFPSLLPFIGELKVYLAGGGAIAWGVVPTSGERVGLDTPATLSARLAGQWSDLLGRGIGREVLGKQSLITPACGTGALPPAQAREIYRTTSQVARNLAGTWPC